MRNILRFICLVWVIYTSPALAFNIEPVVSPKGIQAWLLQDKTVPIIAVAFSFAGGSATDPADKQGLANLVARVLDEGAGPYDSQAFQTKLRDNSIQLSFDADKDFFTGSLKTLVETKDMAAELTRLALTKPRLDAEPVDRMRAAVTAAIQDDERDPGWIARRALFTSLYPNHPYGYRGQGSLDSLKAITTSDLRSFVTSHLTRDRLTVAVAGDLSVEEAGAYVDALFGALPTTGAALHVADGHPALPSGKNPVHVKQPTTQTIIIGAQEGVKRNDPDWFPAALVNYTLGGGGFSSRLMTEIRDKKGLTYGVSSSLVPWKHSSLILVSTATANATAPEVIALVKKSWQELWDKGLTEKELADAKAYAIGALPLQFDSLGDSAAILLQMQQDDLGVDYLNRRADLIQAVTLEDTQRVIKRLFNPETLTLITVGQTDQAEKN